MRCETQWAGLSGPVGRTAFRGWVPTERTRELEHSEVNILKIQRHPTHREPTEVCVLGPAWEETIAILCHFGPHA